MKAVRTLHHSYKAEEHRLDRAIRAMLRNWRSSDMIEGEFYDNLMDDLYGQRNQVRNKIEYLSNWIEGRTHGDDELDDLPDDALEQIKRRLDKRNDLVGL